MRLAALTAIAICAFAGNSLLTRAALGDGLIGAGAFAGIRLISGAVVLLAFGLMRRQSLAPTNSALLGATFLFAYAAAFSFAYLELDAASGRYRIAEIFATRGYSVRDPEDFGAVLPDGFSVRDSRVVRR